MKIGIITIHKILNYGSALQSYALQHFIDTNFECTTEIIDYKFPNDFHVNKRFKGLKRIKRHLHYLKLNFSFKYHKKKRLFSRFWKEQYSVSKKAYSSQRSLMETPPFYDVYLTGSDQVWNTKTLCGDKIMFLDFAPLTSLKFSYAASFAFPTLDEKYKDSFTRYLSSYKAIGVRESSALNILNDLGLKSKGTLVCDPTFLLEKKDYDSLLPNSTLTLLDEPYILVYSLSYAFDPMPAILSTLNKVHAIKKQKVVFINNMVKGFVGNYELIENIGPYEFIHLFSKASFVITSSFHGTAFSVINRTPFLSISPKYKDGRLSDFLRHLSLENRIIYNDQTKPYLEEGEVFNPTVISKIDEYRAESIRYIKNMIEKVKND